MLFPNVPVVISEVQDETFLIPILGDGKRVDDGWGVGHFPDSPGAQKFVDLIRNKLSVPHCGPIIFEIGRVRGLVERDFVTCLYRVQNEFAGPHLHPG